MTEQRNIFLPKKFQHRGIDFFYEDRDVVVIIKSEGVLSVHTMRHERFTVENAVTEFLRKGQSRSSKIAHTVHRLDRETSGAMVFAKNEPAAEFLREHWSENLKLYTALTQGQPQDDHGLLEDYLMEDRDLFMRVCSGKTEGAKLCRTEYTVAKRAKDAAWLSIKLWTGRKNQIRAQFANAGFPVLGDEKYGRSRRKEARLYLHASLLEFTSPSTGKRLRFEAPLPECFERRLGRGAR